VANQFIREWITNYYVDVLASALRRTFGEERSLAIAVNPKPSRVPAPTADVLTAAAAPPPPPPAIVDSDTRLHPDYTFQNFVVGPSNRFAHAAAVAVAEAPGRQFNPFFLHGSVGLGKTHLLQAMCHQITTTHPGSKMLYLSCETFTNHFIEALENGDLSAFRLKYRNVDVLLVDDIHLLANKERTQEEFFHTFNTLYTLGRQIVLSSDAPPKDIPTLQERLVSRFRMGLVLEIATPDYETRVTILKKKARARGSELPDDVARYLAEQVSSNIRELEGSVVRLIGYAALVKAPLSLDLAHVAMRESGSVKPTAVTIENIMEAVTNYFGVKLSDLQSKRRQQSITFPRQICMYLARENTNLSLGEIGGFFGGRDHTTVIHATEKIRRCSEADADLRELLRRLALRIKQA
jgi:chromosomal replication initiator protein